MGRVMNLPIIFVAPTPENSHDGKYLMPRTWTLKDLEIHMMQSMAEFFW